MTPNRQIDPESIQKKLKYAQLGKRLATVLMWCGVAVIVIPTVVFAGLLDIPGEAVPGVLVGMLLFIVGLIIKKITDRRIKRTVAADITRVALAEGMDHLEVFEPRGSIRPSAVKVGMGYPGYDRIGDQTDYIKGTLRGVAIESADFTLEEKEIYYLPDSDQPHRPHERYNTVFQGRIVVCRHRSGISTPVLLNRFTRLADETPTGHEDFDAVYSTRAGTPSDIARVLPPRFREALLELAASPGGDRLAIRYDPDGTLTVVLRDFDFFEIVHSDAKADAATIKARFASQLAIIGRVLDTLAP